MQFIALLCPPLQRLPSAFLPLSLNITQQSGHYVWPAAPALCSYLIHSWQLLPHGKVLELGAGCGLAGLVAAKLPGTTAVIFTDHDPGKSQKIP